MQYLRTEEVIYFHDLLIDKYGGLTGIRDLGLLVSAMVMPQQSFTDVELHQTVYEKAAAYMYHIIKNYPFFDAYKRTGVLACLVFLHRNNVNIDFDEFELEEIAVAVADNRIDKTELAILLEKKK